MKPSAPTIIIKNNSAYTLPADLGNPTSKTIINQQRAFTWNITGELFLSATYISIQVKGNSTQEFQTVQVPLLSANAEGVVSALNTLGIGSFSTLTTGGVTTIVTYNDVLVFGTLTIASPTGYDVELQTFLGEAITTYVLRANGNVIYSFEAPMGGLEINNFNAVPGTVFSLHIVTNTPLSTLQHVDVVKNTSSGFVFIIQDTLPEVGISDYSFTAEADALNYIISVTTI